MRISSSFRISVLAVACVTISGAGRAQAACTPNAGPFCIDGVVTDADNSGVAPGATKVIDPDGSNKELGPINGSSTKIGVINTAAKPMLGDTNPNGSVDLHFIYTQTGIDPATNHVWYYFGWTRDSTSGSGFVSIELQKSGIPSGCTYPNPSTATCNPWSGRQTGDFIILWDQQGNSRNISIRFFTAGVGFGPVIALDASTAVAQYNSDFSGGEVGVDFTATVFPASGACVSFANTIPGTVTGNSDTADYKDAVLSPFPTVSNCGSVTVTKTTQPAGLTGTFPYTLTAPGGIFNTVDDVGTQCADSGTNQSMCQNTLTADGASNTITNLIAKSTYTLTEASVGPSFSEVSVVCTLGSSTYTLFPSGAGSVSSFPVAAGSTTACVITNQKVTGFLDIVKVVTPGFGLTAVPGNFSYSLDGAAATPFANGGTSCTSGAQCKHIEFAVGSQHTVTETPPTGWSVSYNGCSNATIIAAQTVTCTVTNTATQATPSAVTLQRVLLYDRATISGVRRVASGEPGMTMTFTIYPDGTSCQNETGGQGSESVNVTFATGSATSTTVGTSALGYEIKLDSTGNQDVSTAKYWRALFHQTGTNPPNGDFKTPCNEITTVRFQQ
jgi:hypothetical protein